MSYPRTPQLPDKDASRGRTRRRYTVNDVDFDDDSSWLLYLQRGKYRIPVNIVDLDGIIDDRPIAMRFERTCNDVCTRNIPIEYVNHFDRAART